MPDEQDVVSQRLVADDHRGRLRLEAVGGGDQYVRAGARRIQGVAAVGLGDRAAELPSGQRDQRDRGPGTAAPSLPRTTPRTTAVPTTAAGAAGGQLRGRRLRRATAAVGGGRGGLDGRVAARLLRAAAWLFSATSLMNSVTRKASSANGAE